jgi:hypothetical protein
MPAPAPEVPSPAGGIIVALRRRIIGIIVVWVAIGVRIIAAVRVIIPISRIALIRRARG